MVFCNFTRNLERAKEISFTNPYVVASEALLVKKSSGIKSINDMSSRTIATVKGSTNGDEVRSLNMQVKIQEFDSSEAAILAVKQGQADAMIEDNNFLAYQASLDPDLTVTNEALVPLEYNAFGVKAGRSGLAQLPEPVPVQHQRIEAERAALQEVVRHRSALPAESAVLNPRVLNVG